MSVISNDFFDIFAKYNVGRYITYYTCYFTKRVGLLRFNQTLSCCIFESSLPSFSCSAIIACRTFSANSSHWSIVQPFVGIGSSTEIIPCPNDNNCTWKRDINNAWICLLYVKYLLYILTFFHWLLFVVHEVIWRDNDRHYWRLSIYCNFEGTSFKLEHTFAIATCSFGIHPNFYIFIY